MMSVLLELVDVSPSLAAEPLDVQPRRPVKGYVQLCAFFLGYLKGLRVLTAFAGARGR